MDFLIRSVSASDYNSLFQLALKSSITNFPAKKEIINQKIQISLNSFAQTVPKADRNFIFVLKDQEYIIGSSQIKSQYGGKNTPYYTLQISEEADNKSLLFRAHTDKTSYLGGLVLDPSYRGNPERLGRQISLIRLLFLAMNPSWFESTIYTEINPFLDSKGHNPLFEYLSHTYSMKQEDIQTTNVEKWIKLFPKTPIPFSQLPQQVKTSLGKPNQWSKRAEQILKNQNFYFTNQLHPLDGGPCLQGKVSQIPIIQNTKTVFLKKVTDEKVKTKKWFWGQMNNNQFTGGVLRGFLIKDHFFIPKETLLTLNLRENSAIYISEFDSPHQTKDN